MKVQKNKNSKYKSIIYILKRTPDDCQRRLCSWWCVGLVSLRFGVRTLLWGILFTFSFCSTYLSYIPIMLSYLLCFHIYYAFISIMLKLYAIPFRVLAIAEKGIGEFWQLPKRELSSFGNRQTGNWRVLASFGKFGKFWQVLAN